MNAARFRRPLNYFVLFSMLNFIIFVSIAGLIRGDALNGKVVDGHYFLGLHGKYTEVSFLVYLYSRIHASFMIVSWPLVMTGAFYLNWYERKQKRLREEAKRFGLPAMEPELDKPNPKFTTAVQLIVTIWIVGSLTFALLGIHLP